MNKETTSILRECATCAGRGQVAKPLGDLHQQPISGDDPWCDGGSSSMSRGHLVDDHLVKLCDCPECRGTGRVEQRISETEWSLILRRRIFRGFVLLILAMIPFGLLLAAILSSGQAECGSWWYGVILVGWWIRFR